MIKKCQFEDIVNITKVNNGQVNHHYLEHTSIQPNTIQNSYPEITMNLKEIIIELDKRIYPNNNLLKESIDLLLDKKKKHKIKILSKKNQNDKDILLKIDKLIYDIQINSRLGTPHIIIIPHHFISLFEQLIFTGFTKELELKYVNSNLLNDNIIILRQSDKSNLSPNITYYHNDKYYNLVFTNGFENSYEILNIEDLKELRIKKLNRILYDPSKKTQKSLASVFSLTSNKWKKVINLL